MKIKSMRLENYRCFSDLSIDFDERLTALVGVNGAGKTAVLDAVAFFLKIFSFAMEDHKNETFTPTKSDLKLGNDSVKVSYQISARTSLLDFPFSFQKSDLGTIMMNGKSLLLAGPHDLCAVYDRVLQLSNDYNSQKERNVVPITCHYTSKRVLDSYDKSEEWFISKVADEALEAQRLKDYGFSFPELSAVRRAVAMALGDYNEPFARTAPRGIFITHKDHPDQPLQIEQLSDGYRTMLALVMDLARRMAQANEKFAWPEGQGVLDSPAVVLIDEVELHLHPSWQQRVLPSLMEIFPNAQFIVSTHSPQILTSIAARHIRVLKDGEVFSMNEETEGAEASRVLEDVFGVNPRPLSNPFAKKLQEYSALVYDGKWDEKSTKDLRKELDKHFRGSEDKLQKLDLYIKNENWKRAL